MEQYKPIEDDQNGLIDFDPRITGDVDRFKEAIVDNRLWTEVENEDGGTTILNGYHFVNRFRHFITENPYTDGQTIKVDWCEALEEED